MHLSVDLFLVAWSVKAPRFCWGLLTFCGCRSLHSSICTAVFSQSRLLQNEEHSPVVRLCRQFSGTDGEGMAFNPLDCVG